MSDRSRAWRLRLAVLAVFLTAIALRAAPLVRSPLPFNPDGIVYAGHVRIARAAGHLPLFRMPVDDFHFTAFLTVVSAVTGDPALYVAQPTIAVVGAVPVLVAVAAARRIAARVVPRDTSPGVPVLAGALLAVSGLYLHRSMPVDEQTVGLLLVPLGALAYARARRTTDRRWGVVALLVAVSLPPLHDLDSVVFGLFLVAWFALTLARGTTLRRTATAGLAALGYWGFVVAYFTLAARYTPAVVVQADRLLDALDLFAAWLLVAAVGLPWLLGGSRRRQRAIGVGLVAACFGLLSLNAVVPVFPGMPATATPLLVALLPLVVPSVVAAWGLPVVANAHRDGHALLALGAAACLVIGFALTAALTPPYLNTIYRVQTFLHLPWAVVAAVGVGALTHRRHYRWLPDRRVFTGVAAVLVVCAAVSIPVAFAGPPLVPYEGTTTEPELAGVTHATRYVDEPWATGDHLGRLTRYATLTEPYRVAPVYTWAHGGPAPDCPTVARAAWTTQGVQFFPKAAAPVPEHAYRAFLARGDVVYVAGGPGVVTLVRPPTPGRPGC